MNLTLYDLENVKKSCDNLSTIITEIKKAYNPQSIERQLFVNRADYEESLRIKNEVPQDFYFFRLFDIFIQIVFDKKTKYYMIYIDGFYSQQLNKYEQNTRSKKSYIISKDFETTLLLFQDLVNEAFSKKVLQNGLF